MHAQIGTELSRLRTSELISLAQVGRIVRSPRRRRIRRPVRRAADM
ncbi:MAG TPA: hypothetical protein VID69_06920 [Actinomycetota bacterium]|jgi:hypothetical protein